MVLEYLPNGDLRRFLIVSYIIIIIKKTSVKYNFVSTQRNKREVHNLVKYMLDVATGMHYISERGLLHRVTMLYSHKLKHINCYYY